MKPSVLLNINTSFLSFKGINYTFPELGKQLNTHILNLNIAKPNILL